MHSASRSARRAASSPRIGRVEGSGELSLVGRGGREGGARPVSWRLPGL